MSQIKLSPAESKYLQKMSSKMQSQDNRATAFIVFVVYQKESIYVGEDGDYDYTEIIETLTGDFCSYKSKHEAKEELRKSGYDKISEDDLDIRYLKEIDKFVTLFFTEESAQRYIESNPHHLNKPYIYGESAYNNLDLKTIQRLLMNGLDDHKNGVYSTPVDSN